MCNSTLPAQPPSGSSPAASRTEAVAFSYFDDSNGRITDARNDIQSSASADAAAGISAEVSDSSLSQLNLADVIASLYSYFPTIQQAKLERSRASGQLLSCYGAYDTKLQGYSLSEPTGYYRNYRQGIGFARQTWWGSYISAGYRMGRGQFQPWYKERETNEAGELKLSAGIPLLQGRAIDEQRVAVLQANVAQQAVDPLIQQTILDAAHDACEAYWQWLAAGKIFAAQKELLQLAILRGQQYEIGVKAGKFAEIDLILNEQLIAERRTKVLESEQKFRAASFKLSFFLRDDVGQPLVPEDAWQPSSFPELTHIPAGDFQADLAAAMQRRPEPRLIQREIQQINYERQLAHNNMSPRFDLISEASQDLGIPASSNNDKGQFELTIGFQGEVPVQRSKARGKIQETNAKLAQLTQKLILLSNKIGIELQVSFNAFMIAQQVAEQAEQSLNAAVETLSRYRFGFERGKVDLIYLNLLETKVNETEVKVVEAQQNAFMALSALQAALGLDPLEQALLISELPNAVFSGPGHMPEPASLNPVEFNTDWQRHLAPTGQ